MSRTIIPLFLLLSACALQSFSGEKPLVTTTEEPAALRFELLPERTPNNNEALWLEVRVGALPNASTLILRDLEGETIGSVSPYGKTSRQAGGGYLVPLPASMQHEKITLRVELVLAHNEVRRPTEDELEEVRLVYLAVSP